MIKNILYAFVIFSQISSCSFISFSDSIPLVKAAIIGFENQPVTLEEFNLNEYSFAVAKFNRGQEARIVLSSINSKGLETWIAPNNIKLFIKKGKILKTEGLDHDYEIINWQDSTDESSKTNYISLTNPRAIFKQTTLRDVLKQDYIDFHYESVVQTNLLKEMVNIKELNQKNVNYYWFGQDGKIKRTSQYINPKLPKITIDFFYKY